MRQGLSIKIVMSIWVLMGVLLGCEANTPTPPSATPVPSQTMSATPIIRAQAETRVFSTETATPTITPSATMTLPPTATVANGLLPTVDINFTPSPTATATINLSNTTRHTVQRGESLTSIANLYRVSVGELETLNNIAIGQVIFVGQILYVPVIHPTATVTSTPSATPEGNSAFTFNQKSWLPIPDAVNDLAYADFVVMPPEVITNVQAIFAEGQARGRDPFVFSRLGDSTIEPPHFFYRFDSADYHLGDYAYLERTIQHYSGSFSYDNVTVRRGLSTWAVFDPMWADESCEQGEDMLTCEIRQHNPSILFVRMGSNDGSSPEQIRENFTRIIEYCIEQGVVPVLGTKADRYGDYLDNTNTTIRELADEYAIPLWDFDIVAQTLPNNGLVNDRVHLTYFYANDWRLSRGFTTGHGVHNLTGLIMLDELRQVIRDAD